MKGLKTKFALVLPLLVALVSGPALGQARDNLPAPNQGVCDDLTSGTPGLYGLCIAFCEAQACEPDFNAADPFDQCKPSASILLDLYNDNREPGDPGMPCIQQPCPCWTENELDALRFPAAGDTQVICLDNDGPNNRDSWLIRRVDSSQVEYETLVETATLPVTGPACTLIDRCDDGSCLDTVRFTNLNAAEFANCQADVVRSGTERGFDCWLE